MPHELTVATRDNADTYFQTRRPARWDSGDGKGWKDIDGKIRDGLILQAIDELQLTQGIVLQDPTLVEEGVIFLRDDYAVFEQAYWISLRELNPQTSLDKKTLTRGKRSKRARQSETMQDIAPQAKLWLRLATNKIVRG